MRGTIAFRFALQEEPDIVARCVGTVLQLLVVFQLKLQGALSGVETERRHGQQTGGIMGLLTLVKGMPIRLTKTVQRHVDNRLVKNNKGELHG